MKTDNLQMRLGGWIAILIFLLTGSSSAPAGNGSDDLDEKRQNCLQLFRSLIGGVVHTLPSVFGSRDNIPKSLRRVPENRILFGIEAEYSAAANFLTRSASPNIRASELGPQDLFKFYDGAIESMGKPNIALRSPDELRLLPAEDRWVVPYLPRYVMREQGKLATQEVATEVLPNMATFARVLDAIDTRIGHGSYQGMVSVPYATVARLGKGELTGFIHLANELSTLSAMARPRQFHPFLHPFNLPYQNEDFGIVHSLRRELDQFFHSPGYASDLIPKMMGNPKYTLGLAPRFDLTSTYGGARLFFEIRGCKENPECVKRLAALVTRVFEDETRGFAAFASLDTLLNEAPWKLSEAWREIPDHERHGIRSTFKKITEIYASGSLEIANNFLYPLKDWDSIASQLGMDTAQRDRLRQAQRRYVQVLRSGEWRSKENPDGVGNLIDHLGPALETFARESGLLEHLQSRWEEITSMQWEVDF